MPIREDEQALFKRWRQRRPDFVSDGVVSEHDYLASNPKIALVLKEVNDPDSEGWDLREFLAGGARPRTWNNVARWTHGMRNRHRLPEPGWEEQYEEVDEDFRRQELRYLCVINLKKSPGGGAADMNEIWAFAEEDKKFIHEQYAIYDPDLTVCGGTGDIFPHVVLDIDETGWRRTHRGIWWYEREANKYILSYNHPEARVQEPLLHYGLVDAVAELLR